MDSCRLIRDKHEMHGFVLLLILGIANVRITSVEIFSFCGEQISLRFLEFDKTNLKRPTHDYLKR